MTGCSTRRRPRLLNRGLRLPLLGHDDETADIRHIKHIVLSRARERGARDGLEYAEKFHFVSPERPHFKLHTRPLVDRLVEEQAGPLDAISFPIPRIH